MSQTYRKASVAKPKGQGHPGCQDKAEPRDLFISGVETVENGLSVTDTRSTS